LFEWDPVEFLYAFANGENVRGAYRLNDIAVGVIPVLPPFPATPKNYEDIIGIPIFEMADDFSFEEVQAWGGDKSGVKAAYATAGTVIGVACASGPTVHQAAHKCYAELKKLKMPASPFWRNDIGEKLRKELPELQEHGFASGMEY
jgi:phosphoribosylamine-glycine ligase